MGINSAGLCSIWKGQEDQEFKGILSYVKPRPHHPILLSKPQTKQIWGGGTMEKMRKI